MDCSWASTAATSGTQGWMDAHHREMLVVADVCSGGWYTLLADLDASSDWVQSVDLSLQLAGIPRTQGRSAEATRPPCDPTVGILSTEDGALGSIMQGWMSRSR